MKKISRYLQWFSRQRWKYKKYSFGTKRDRSFRWNAVFGESTAVIPQKRHTIMSFRVLYKLWERGDSAWKESGEIRSVTSGDGKWWQNPGSPGVRPRDTADVHKTPQPGVEDAKVYGSRSGTLEQLRLSLEQYLRRQCIGRHCWQGGSEFPQTCAASWRCPYRANAQVKKENRQKMLFLINDV